MKQGLEIWCCTGCGKAFFPERYMCSQCRGGEFSREVTRGGVVEEVSMIHHMLGQENWKPRAIASVRTDAGVLITAGLLDDASEGDEIVLCQDEGAPFARAKGADAD